MNVSSEVHVLYLSESCFVLFSQIAGETNQEAALAGKKTVETVKAVSASVWSLYRF